MITPGPLHLCDTPDRKAQAHGRRCGVAPGYTEATRDHLHAAGGCPRGLRVDTQGLLKERKAGATCQLQPGCRRCSLRLDPGSAAAGQPLLARPRAGQGPLPATRAGSLLSLPPPAPGRELRGARPGAQPRPRPGPHPDGQRAVLAAYSTAAVRAAGLRGAAVLLLLPEDLGVELLEPNDKGESVTNRASGRRPAATVPNLSGTRDQPGGRWSSTDQVGWGGPRS